MMRMSGVSCAVWAAKLAREIPRRAASGHRPAMQAGKSAAAWRLAPAAMAGCPESPDSPLHPLVFGVIGLVAGASDPVGPGSAANPTGGRLSLWAQAARKPVNSSDAAVAPRVGIGWR